MMRSMKSYFFSNWIMSPVISLIALTPPEGAHTTLFAATSGAIAADKRKYAGQYLTPFGVITEPPEHCRDMVAAHDLWDTTERLASTL